MLVLVALAHVELKLIGAAVETAPVRNGHFHIDLIGRKRSALQGVRLPAHADLQKLPTSECVAAVLRQHKIERALGLADDEPRIVELRDKVDADKLASHRNAGGGTGKTRLLARHFDAERITPDAAIGAGPIASVRRLALDPRADLTAGDCRRCVPEDGPADRQNEQRENRHVEAEAAVPFRGLSCCVRHHLPRSESTGLCYRIAGKPSAPAGTSGDAVMGAGTRTRSRASAGRAASAGAAFAAATASGVLDKNPARSSALRAAIASSALSSTSDQESAAVPLSAISSPRRCVRFFLASKISQTYD